MAQIDEKIGTLKLYKMLLVLIKKCTYTPINKHLLTTASGAYVSDWSDCLDAMYPQKSLLKLT